MPTTGKATWLRAQWEPLLGGITGTWVMLVHPDSGVTWGSFCITGYELGPNGSFELTLFTTNQHTPQIKIDADHPWQPQRTS